MVDQALSDDTAVHDITRNPESIWLSPICDDTAHHGEGRTWAAPSPDESCEDCGEPWVKYVRVDLASVSSASAEIPAGMKPWTGGDGAPDDWDGGSVLRADGQTEHSDDITIQQWKHPVPRCKWNVVAYTPARVLDLPEPVPATNQAGEVTYNCSASHCAGYGPWKILAIHNDSAWIVHQRDDRFIYRSVDFADLNPPVALPSQPTSRQSVLTNMTALDDEIEAAHPGWMVGQPVTSQEEEARDTAMRPDETAIGYAKRLRDMDAATPTPPTLSEDLREAIARIVCQIVVQITCAENATDASIQAQVDQSWQHWTDTADRILARAQVKAS